MGDVSCDFKLLQSRIDYIANTPNAYCILSGDLMNTATKSSVSDIYSETISPMEQLKQCVKVFGPIKDKILCIVPGNHEQRTYKTEGIDLTAIMAAQLDIHERYSETTALLFVRLGANTRVGPDRRFCYTIYVTHGAGGGRKEGGKINRLADLAAIVDADIYIHSHSHFPAIFKEGYFRVDKNNFSVSMVDKLFINTSAHLDYGGYGDAQGYKPSSKDTPVIHISGKIKSATATL
jgi:predicted phosphodiesterase